MHEEGPEIKLRVISSRKHCWEVCSLQNLKDIERCSIDTRSDENLNNFHWLGVPLHYILAHFSDYSEILDSFYDNNTDPFLKHIKSIDVFQYVL